MKKILVERWKRMVRERMAIHFPAMADYPLSAYEKQMFAPTPVVFRQQLESSKWGLCVFTADARDEDRILASVGWSFVEPLRPVKLRDGLFDRRDGLCFPRATGAWGLDGIEFLAGQNASLGWRVDVDPAGFDASCAEALNETFALLVRELPGFFQRISNIEPSFA